jgi:RimJ/RimL family protein N-acetyltransferase
MLLALHARVLVDRHAASVLCRSVVTWTSPALDGRIVRLEPMAEPHAEGLWEASRDPRVWRWLPVVQPATREAWSEWVADALAAGAAGTEIPLVTRRHAEDARILGSTRFLALRPEHLSVEIGWTWLAPEAWGTGANTEAKLLMLAHAFESWGCRRVELKTDALNAPARRAMESFGAVFEGVHRNHMVVRGGEQRDSAWYSVVDDEWPEVKAGLERATA